MPKGFEIRTLPENTEKALMSCVEDADYILASGRVRIGAAAMEGAKRLRMIQRTGVGLDSLDLNAIKKAGIPLYVNQGINAQSVAEHTLLLILACLRRLTVIDRNTKSGVWKKQAQGVTTRELAGKTVGIIGMGSIGKKVSMLLGAFGARVLYHSRTRLSPEEEVALGIVWAQEEEIYAAADIISLHCSLTGETRHMIDRDALSAMREGVVIVNTARGALICEEDLAQAIRSGRVGFAGLDVYETEPVNPGSPLFELENVICTPHIGGVTYDAFHGMMQAAMRNICLFEHGHLEEIENSRYPL